MNLRCMICGNIMIHDGSTVWHCPICNPKKEEAHICAVCGKYVTHQDMYCPERIQV